VQAELLGELPEQRDERRPPARELGGQALAHGVVLERQHEQALVQPHRLDRRGLGDPRDHGAHPLLGRAGTVYELLERLNPVQPGVHDEGERELALVGEVVVDHAV
jgi:hypothetical protein